MPTYTDAGGIAIHYASWRVDPAGPPPRAVIQLVHGVAEHIGRYTEVIAALNAAGYSVWAEDHRGHGMTGMVQWNGDRSLLGKPGPGGLRAVRDAIERFTDVIRATEEPTVPIVLLGHSWGSMLVQMMLNRHAERYAGAVLTGTCYRVLGSMNTGPLNARFAHHGDTGYEWLSRDPTVVATFLADPLTAKHPLQHNLHPLDLLRLFGRPARQVGADIPVLMMIGSEDPLGGERSVQRLACAFRRRSGFTDVATIVYEGARHEVFHETNRTEVFADLVAWLQARFGAAGGGDGSQER